MAILPLRQAIIRPWRDDDAPSMAAHFNSRAIWRNLRDEFPYPYTLEGRCRDQIVKDGELRDGLLYAILMSDVGHASAARVPSR